MTDYDILFLLDGGRNSLHLGSALSRKRSKQEFVLNGYRSVEAGIEFAAGNVELTSQLKINVDCAAVCFV